MTVLPGSLDYLYYDGILDHIPYEAYGPVGQYGYGCRYAQPSYLDCAKQGSAYYMNIPDAYCCSNPDPSLNQNSKTETKNTARKILSSNIFWGIVALIPLSILGHYGIKHAKNICTNIKNAEGWSKLNPKTWFKKS